MKFNSLSGHALFWSLVFLLNTGPHWELYSSIREHIESVGLITLLQALVALITIKYLVPTLLSKGQTLLFILSLLALLLLASEINILVRVLYLEKTYSGSYTQFLGSFGHMPLLDRMFSLWTMKYIFFTKLPLYIFPTAVLMANNFHQQQQHVLKLSEQKRSAELDALKSQLNPHFIFNTLNNIYSLALKKSDLTPTAIEKLSGILDYVLYRCNDEYVQLGNEIELIESYIALEKIRYGKRLDVSFNSNADESKKIAPLLLLTLLENACKHSTVEELNTAKINIDLSSSAKEVIFKLVNSKPTQLNVSNRETEQIGLSNLKKQLDLLYPETYQLEVEETADSYSTTLTLAVI